MSERKTEKREMEWTDGITDPEEDDSSETSEDTYRDGSIKHECWKDD